MFAHVGTLPNINLTFKGHSKTFVTPLPIFVVTDLKVDEMVKPKIVFRSPTVASQSPETELILDGDNDNVSLLQEKEVDNLGGTSACQHFYYHSVSVTWETIILIF